MYIEIYAISGQNNTLKHTKQTTCGFYTLILYKLKFWAIVQIWLIFGIVEEEESVALYLQALPVLEWAKLNVKMMHSML